MVTTVEVKKEAVKGAEEVKRAGYFIDRLKELLATKKELEFSDYVAVSGLLELSRQYITMPDGVKELSSSGLKDSIINVISKHGTLLAYKDSLPIKELKEPLLNLYLCCQLKKDKYFETLFTNLSNVKTCLGVWRAIKHLIVNGIPGAPQEDICNIIDDLLFLLVEYLDFRGHTLSEIYRFCQQQEQKYDSFELFESIFNHLKSTTTVKISNLPAITCYLHIECKKDKITLVESFSERILKSLSKEKRISTKIDTQTEELEEKVRITKEFTVFNIDNSYIDRLCKNIHLSFRILIDRTKSQDIKVDIEKRTKSKRVKIAYPASIKNSTLKVKYFDKFWSSASFLELSDYLYEEIFRINDWVNTIDKSSERLISFNALWSILESLLIDSFHENKIDAICSNFTPYLGLFYFRKILKTSFKKQVGYLDGDQKEAQEKLVKWVTAKVDSLGISYKSIADAYCVFMYHKKLKDKWWDGFSFKASPYYMNMQTLRIHNQLHAPTSGLDKFETMVKNDLKQMYRLRNMITHSAISDSKMLENTYDRLKYYVETLLNAISYAWINQAAEFTTVFDISDYKKVDYITYKEHYKKMQNDNLKAIELVNYNGLTLIPPNRFSFLEQEIK